MFREIRGVLRRHSAQRKADNGLTWYRKPGVKGGLTTPHALENVQTWPVAEGFYSRLTRIHRSRNRGETGIGKPNRQAGSIKSLGSFLWQRGLPSATAIDGCWRRRVHRWRRPIVMIPVATGCFRRGGIGCAMHPATARSCWESQQETAGEGGDLEKERVHSPHSTQAAPKGLSKKRVKFPLTRTAADHTKPSATVGNPPTPRRSA